MFNLFYFRPSADFLWLAYWFSPDEFTLELDFIGISNHSRKNLFELLHIFIQSKDSFSMINKPRTAKSAPSVRLKILTGQILLYEMPTTKKKQRMGHFVKLLEIIALPIFFWIGSS